MDGSAHDESRRNRTGDLGRAAPASPRVCVFTRIWRSAGTGLFAQELVDGLLAAGAHVTFVSPQTESAAFERPRANLVRIRQPRERGPDASAPVRLLASLARIGGGAIGLLRARFANRVFIISLPDPFVFAVPTMLLLRLTGARLIFVVHDVLPHAWRFSERLRALERFGYFAIYAAASDIVVLSEPSRAMMRRAFPRLRVPVSVIEHGVFLLPRQTVLPGHGQLLCFGTIRRNKGTLAAMAGVVAAASDGVPVRLVIAGEAHWVDTGYADACAAFAATAPDVIDLRIGYVADDALAELFEQSDALLMPYSDFHSQSGVALLAASNGRPAIASAAGGIATLIDEGMAAVVIAEPVSPESVAAAVRSFFAAPAATWRVRAEEYRAETLRRRSWLAIARDYLVLAASRR